jgi:pantoate--beta-alanine ligase
MTITTESKAHLEETLSAHRTAGYRIGFVPTMGALHEGHLSLIRAAREANDIVVVSIFVNPTQFNDPEDYRNYPRTREADKLRLEEEGVDIAFMPDEAEMYPEGRQSLADFDPGYLGQVLEGEKRPGHFEGMATIVKKLLETVKPDYAYFGQKDYQQLLIVRGLVNTYQLPVSIISEPIVRESDGLALSSRNVLLTPEERELAPVIYQTLKYCRDQVEHDFRPDEISQEGIAALNRYEAFTLEYFTIRNAFTLAPVTPAEKPKAVVILVALGIGKVRLIDNMLAYPFQ